MRARLRLVVACLIALGAWAPAGASAATYTVTGTGDTVGAACAGTVCDTLRAAVNAAAADPGSTVQLEGKAYQLSPLAGLGELVLNSAGSFTIAGVSAATTSIGPEPMQHLRLIHHTGGNVTLRDLKVAGGFLEGVFGARRRVEAASPSTPAQV